MSVEIIQGECREVLAGLPAESVQTCITSPPYYGLRTYQTPPHVWGGDPSCDHEWDEMRSTLEQGNKRKPVDLDHQRDRSHDKAVPQTVSVEAARCPRCAAWRGELGAEVHPQLYVAHLVEAFRAVHRVLRDDGTAWLVIGDSYVGGGGFWPDAPSNVAGSKQTTQRGSIKARRSACSMPAKNLLLIPHRVALALQDAGWYVRQELVWSKPAPMPESVTDRCTRSHEFIFMLAKQPAYYYDQDAIREPHTTCLPVVAKARSRDRHADDGPLGERPLDAWGALGYHALGRNKRSVWTVGPQPLADEHYAAFPEKLVEPMILAGCPEGGAVLDPFCGSGTTLLAAKRLGRSAVGIDLNPTYVTLARKRVASIPYTLFNAASSMDGAAR